MLHDVVHDRGPGGAPDGVAAVGVAVGEGLTEGVVHLVAGDGGAQRHVAAREALGGGYDVGHRVPVVEAPLLTCPPEPRHDLVGDEEDVMLVAYLADQLEVARRRWNRAQRGADHGLSDEGRDVLWARRPYLGVKCTGAFKIAGIAGLTEPAPVTVRRRYVGEV